MAADRNTTAADSIPSMRDILDEMIEGLLDGSYNRGSAMMAMNTAKRDQSLDILFDDAAFDETDALALTA